MFIGSAGWSIASRYAPKFPGNGSHLERYGAVLNAVEINSSFYRPHQRKTYERWADSVPKDFRFSVKVPRSVTHERRLTDCEDLLARFLDEAGGLGKKLGLLLVQLPPSLIYDAKAASGFFRALHKSKSLLACEPRHASWFTDEADAALSKLKVARVAADPPRAEIDATPGGWDGFAYWRLHGSPKIYYSDYSAKALKSVASTLGKADWCIFDNTAAFAALGNALTMKKLTSV